MKKVAITKCDFCSQSVNKKGVLVCPHGTCIRSKKELEELLKLILNKKESEDTVCNFQQEVRHGYWEEIKCGDEMFDYYFKCSNCGNTTPPKAFPIAPDYCPNCGAKMDGERSKDNGK